MTDNEQTATADPPETSQPDALDDVMSSVFGKKEPKADPHEKIEPEDSKADDAATNPPDSKKEPGKDAPDTPVELTNRQKQGAQLMDATPEEIAAADDKQRAVWDKAATAYARAMGKTGQAVREARAKQAIEPEPEPDEDDGDDQQDADEAGDDQPRPKADDAEYDDLTDEFGDLNPEKLKQALVSERQRRTALEAAQTEMTSTMQQLVADQFIAGLDPKVFSHLGDGPTWKLDKDSPQYKARADMIDLAVNYATGVMVTTGKSISFLEALGRTTIGAEQIGESVSKNRSDAARAKQRGAVHEPGRARARTSPESEDADAALERAMQKAGLD